MGLAIGVRQRPFFGNLVNAVITQAADIAAAVFHDGVEQLELGITAVHDIQPVAFQHPFEHRAFVMLAARVGRDVDAVGHVFRDVEMRVQTPLHLSAAGLPLKHNTVQLAITTHSSKRFIKGLSRR